MKGEDIGVMYAIRKTMCTPWKDTIDTIITLLIKLVGIKINQISINFGESVSVNMDVFVT